MNVGQAVKMARNLRGLTQVELGARAGLDDAYISFIENDKREPGLDALTRLATALDLPLLYLLYLACTPEERALPRSLENRFDALVLQRLTHKENKA